MDGARKEAESFLRKTYDHLPKDRTQGLDREAWVQTNLIGNQGLFSPWVQWFLRFDPAPMLRHLRSPVLAITGERNLHVGAAQNLGPIQAALQGGGNPDYMIACLPGISHSLQTVGDRGLLEYRSIEETVAPIVLETMTAWLKCRLAPAAR